MPRWKNIPGYPGYQASDDGQIRSLRVNSGGRIKKQHYSSNGYLRVCVIAQSGKSHCIGVHRLIALAFLPNPDNLPEVNHKNGVKDDNRLENLEWVTSSENHRHAYRVLGKKSAAKGRQYSCKAKLLPTEVRIIRTTTLGLSELAEYFGIDQSTVYNIRKRKTYKYID